MPKQTQTTFYSIFSVQYGFAVSEVPVSFHILSVQTLVSFCSEVCQNLDPGGVFISWYWYAYVPRGHPAREHLTPMELSDRWGAFFTAPLIALQEEGMRVQVPQSMPALLDSGAVLSSQASSVKLVALDLQESSPKGPALRMGQLRASGCLRAQRNI